jgi:hypothetical protein
MVSKDRKTIAKDLKRKKAKKSWATYKNKRNGEAQIAQRSVGLPMKSIVVVYKCNKLFSQIKRNHVTDKK